MTQTKQNITPKQLEKIAMQACLNAGKYLRENAYNITGLEWKHTDDPVTDLDKKAERIIRSHIKKYLVANVYGEEYGVENNNSDINVYTDPNDGTKSLIRGEFMSSVSLAIDAKGKMVTAMVYDYMRDILYYANDDGAFISTPHREKTMRLPIIKVRFSKPTIAFDGMEEYRETLNGKAGTRKCIGSIALAMAQLAAGSYDGIIMRPKIKDGITDICDIAAGYYIMKQAGITITDAFFEDYDYRCPASGIIAMREGKDMKEIAKLMNSAAPYAAAWKN